MALRKHGGASRPGAPWLLAGLVLAITASLAWAQIVLPGGGGSGSGQGGGVTAPGGNPPAPTFLFRVCNESSVTAAVSVLGRLDEKSPQDWIIAGWWMVGPGACGNLTRALWGYFYAHAEEQGRGASGPNWPNRTGETADFCIEYPGPFTRVRRESMTCDDELLKTFRTMQVKPGGGDTYTWTLQ